jgi:hypothetical protein
LTEIINCNRCRNLENTCNRVGNSSLSHLCKILGSEGVCCVVHVALDAAAGYRMVDAVSECLTSIALQECIGALTEKRPYVPYQNSKLTMLLSGALGGDSKTVCPAARSCVVVHLLMCCSPAHVLYTHSCVVHLLMCCSPAHVLFTCSCVVHPARSVCPYYSARN